MDVREKLFTLFQDCNNPSWKWFPNNAEMLKLIDYLIANGVTVQECGHWVSYQSDEPYGSQDEKEWYRCSKCGKDAYGRCYEDEWYSAPILSANCPHCGEKMMPQPPKGE